MDFTAMRSGWIGKDPKIMGGVVPWIGNVLGHHDGRPD